MEMTAKELAAALGGTVEGDPEAKVSSFAKIEHGRPGQLCFFANPKYEKYVYTSKASVLLVNCDFEPKESADESTKKTADGRSETGDMHNASL